MAVKDGLPATDFSRMNREYIKAVAEGGSGGGGLPEITEADEGKFLGVVSGEAAWATAGGGVEVFWINVSYTTEGGERTGAVTDKTAAEIAGAIAAHKLLIAILDESDEGETSYKYGLVEAYAFVPADTMYVAMMFDWEFSATSSSDYMTYVFE